MRLLKEIQHLLLKEIRLELRQRYAISGILLYVISTVFVVYMTLGQTVKGAVWASIFWIIVLFASVSAVAKSFVQENSKRQLHYYSLTSPSSIIISKSIYNSLLLAVVNFLAYGLISVVLSNPIEQNSIFIPTLLMGSIGFSLAFTFIAAISSKAGQSATLMAILSFPVILPILLVLMRLTKIALGLMTDTAYYKDLLLLLSIDGILAGLMFILFPYLWRD